MAQDTEQLTEEQIKEQNKKLNEFYEEMIPILEKQLKYEEFKERIAISRARRKQAEVSYAQLHTGPLETGEKAK